MLRDRGMDPMPKYPCCKLGKEIAKHALFLYSKSKADLVDNWYVVSNYSFKNTCLDLPEDPEAEK